MGPPGSGTSLLGCKKTHSFHKHQRLGFHQDPPCRREVEADEGGKAGKDTFSCCTVGNFWPTGVCVALLNTHTGQLEAPPTTVVVDVVVVIPKQIVHLLHVRQDIVVVVVVVVVVDVAVVVVFVIVVVLGKGLTRQEDG